jgi:hypothetical protein
MDHLMENQQAFWFEIFDRSERSGISIEHQFFHMRQYTLRNDHAVAWGLFIRWARTRGVFDLPGPSYLPHLRVRPEARFNPNRWNERAAVEPAVEKLYTRANLLKTRNGAATTLRIGHPLAPVTEECEEENCTCACDCGEC